MDELTGRELQILLRLKEGRGFNSIQYPLRITASLDGYHLDTNAVPPCSEPQIGEELSWVIGRTRLRRLRTTTGHIRVECYLQVGPHERENIGFLMLNLKSAQMQTDRHSVVSESWHKLIGKGTDRPELLLSYCICSAALQQHESPYAMMLAERNVHKCSGDYVDMAAQLPSDQGIIQIGPENVGTDIFLLTILVGEISNLHLLIPENLDSKHDEKYTFHFCYTVCGHTINTAHFSVDPNCRTIIPDNRKIVIRIRSSLSVLRTYFDSQSVVPFLMMSDKGEVASTSVNLKTLIPTDNLEEFCSIYACDNDGLVQKSECYLSSAKTQQVPVGNDGSKPSVNVMLLLKFVERQVAPTIGLGSDTSRTYTMPKHQSTGQTEKESDVLQEHCPNSLSAPQFVNDPESNKHSTSSRTVQSETKQSCSLGKPYMENQKCASQDDPTTYLFLQQDMLQSEDPSSETQSVSCPGMRNSSEQQSHESVLTHLAFGDRSLPQPVHCLPRSAVEGSSYALRRYDLSIMLESVKFRKAFSEKKVFFKFYHPNAEVVCARHTDVSVHNVGEELSLKNVSCRLGFHSLPSQISHLLLASPPMVIMCSRTSTEQTLVLASTALNTAALLCTDKRQCCFSKGLRNISTPEQVAVVKVSLKLEEADVQMMCGNSLRRKIPEHSLGGHAVSEDAAYKVVEELEEWKEKQQAIFKAELREKEKVHLALLMDDWYLKKAEIESTLKKDVDNCAKMKEDLERAQEELRLGLEKVADREKQVQILKEKLETEWTRKLSELEDVGAKLEHDIDKEAQWRAEKADLDQMVTTLQQEVTLWKETVKMREAELEDMKKNNLTKDSATYLFQDLKMIEEKLEAALKLKRFYKEHWVRAVKEILHLKTASTNGLQISISRAERDQLENQGAIKTLHEIDAAKKDDQDVLKTIKERMNKSWLNIPGHQETSDATTRGFQSESSILLLKQKLPDVYSSVDEPSKRDVENALHGMIAERDALLRTGNYNMEDPIITKLNQDMCVLLAELKN